ncbi:MAG TPA: DivIVA domain-containing protein [Solirubrobacteraceae bacterium]|jgi:DivIVA domain-containing protein
MPDQSSAATEHAILAEITAPLETLPDDPLAVVNADFPVALRGYDRIAVDAYVQQTAQLVAELQATRSPEAAVRRALERVGEQISGILQRAHETAEEITVQSRREAEDRLEKARIEAAEIAAAAQRRVSDLDTDTDRIWSERHRIVDDARELAQQLIALAETAAERFPPAESGLYDDETAATRAPMGPAESEPGEPLADDLVDHESSAEVFDDDGGFAEDVDDESDAGERQAGEHQAGERQAGKHQAREPDAGEPGVREPAAEGIDPDETDETVAFTPLEADSDAEGRYDAPEDVADPPEPPTPPRGSSSVIPPASQAANRRSSQ